MPTCKPKLRVAGRKRERDLWGGGGEPGLTVYVNGEYITVDGKRNVPRAPDIEPAEALRAKFTSGTIHRG